MTRPTRRLRLCALSLFLAAGCRTAPAPSGPPLRFGVLPWGDREECFKQVARAVTYLEETLGSKIEVEMPATYNETARAVAAKRWDFAFLSAVPYSRAHEAGWDAVAVTQRHGAVSSRGLIVARTDRGLKTVTDLKGKKLAYVDPGSSSGFLFPFALLAASGLGEKDYQRAFLHSHHEVLRAVLKGDYDAGALYEPVAQEALRKGELVVIGQTDEIPNDLFTVRHDSPSAEAIRRALMTLAGSPRAAEVLEPLGAQALVAADEKSFDHTRQIDLLVSEQGGL